MKKMQNNDSGENKFGNEQKESNAPVEPVSEKDEVKEAEERTRQSQKDADDKRTREETSED